MLELAKIEQLAQTYSPQELFAVLVWNRRFNEFDGREVITDLVNYPELWASFCKRSLSSRYASNGRNLSRATQTRRLLKIQTPRAI